MLISLDVKNVALIESLHVEFLKGLNILSGETGAGKSILIDALGLALGERADRGLIRTGQEKAVVQALFDISANEAALAFIDENQLECDEGVCSASREISVSGRSVCRICGMVVPLNMLKTFTGLIVDIHGQHEHQSLLKEEYHLKCVDGFGGAEIADLLGRTEKSYGDFSGARKRLRDFAGSASEMARRIDTLAYQIDEIKAANLRPGEEEELSKRKEFFKNAQQIAQAVSDAKSVLDGGLLGFLKNAARGLETAGRFDGKYRELAERIDESYYNLEDVSYEISSLAEGLEYDEREVDAVEERLEALNMLKRKYGKDISEVLKHLSSAQDELERLINGEATLKKLEEEVEKARNILERDCEVLSLARKKTAGLFCERVVEHLADLNMSKIRFEAEFEKREPSAQGWDSIRFMIAANPGEALKPLSRTASGGEMSRIMLALKSITAQNDGIDTMIFDEIDSGISGRVAMSVAKKMRSIAKDRQVLCVTHLATIAAAGDAHFLIEKSSAQDRTVTKLQRLEGDERTAEIARLSGGGESETAMAHAREMLVKAKKL
ncbi:MAG: DNA repair protein RecN [Christensenellales bacterium]|jgi:DNA repair protein RecN (Recombination protein N)